MDMLGVNAQMSKISLNYSIETLIHYICGNCGKPWTESNNAVLLTMPELPESISCPKCKFEFNRFNNITEVWNFCPTHEIWHHTPECPMCDKPDTFHKGYLAGLHDAPKLMELPGE